MNKLNVVKEKAQNKSAMQKKSKNETKERLLDKKYILPFS